MLTKNQSIEYFIYCRKSKGKQDEKSPSIDAQYNELINFAEKENLKIIDIFKETQSAFEIGRPKFKEMIERIKNKEANGILVWEISRLSRNMQDNAIIDKLLNDKKLLKIQSPGRDYIDNDGEDFLLNMELVISRQYSKEISKRTKRGLRYKLQEKGEWPGWSPIGYLNIDIENQKIRDKLNPRKEEIEKMLKQIWKKENRLPNKIEIDPLTKPLIKKVFEDYATGNYSLSVMLEKIEIMGLKGRTGKAISKSKLVHMLKNPFYFGNIRFGGQLYEGSHKPIITKALFDEVQLALKNKGKPIKKRWGFAFTGLIRCGYCGCLITAEKKKNKYVYYHCTHKRDRLKSTPCPQQTIKEKELRKLLSKEVKKITINDMIKELLIEAMKQGHKREKELHQKGIKEWEIMYQNAERKINSAFELFSCGEMDIEEYKQRKEEALNQKQKAKEHLDVHGEAQKAWLGYSEKLIISTNQAYKIFKEGTPEEVKTLLSAIGRNYVLKDGNLTLELKEPFNLIARLNNSKSSNKTDLLRG
jgi:site-specific DNA recombinase